MDGVSLTARHVGHHRRLPARRLAAAGFGVGFLAAACCLPAGAEATAEIPGANWVAAVRRACEGLEWSDLVIRHDWRLQRHARDGSCRILDPADGTLRAGTEAECRTVFAALEQAGTIPRSAADTVILLHGLGENRGSMQPLAEHLRRELDHDVICFGYASVATELDDHGRDLGEVIARLSPDARISFVGHSLGNLVVRRWMAMANERDLARVERMVMLGPPNQGSELARMAGNIRWLADHASGSARELVLDWPRVAPLLAVPACEFAIIAGGRGDDQGYSPLLAGDDDAVVRVDETRLEGAREFIVLPVRHAAMMRDPAVQRAASDFLASGRIPADQRP